MQLHSEWSGAALAHNVTKVPVYDKFSGVSVLITYASKIQCLLPQIVNIPKDSIKVKIDLYLVHPGQRLCQLCAQVVYHPVHREYHGVEYLNICLTCLE